MLAGETIEQTRVSLAAVAMAVAGLLVKRLFDPRRNRVGILHQRIGKGFRLHCFGEVAFGSLGMVGGHGVVSCRARRISFLRRSGSRSQWNEGERQSQTEESRRAPGSCNSRHILLPTTNLPLRSLLHDRKIDV